VQASLLVVVWSGHLCDVVGSSSSSSSSSSLVICFSGVERRDLVCACVCVPGGSGDLVARPSVLALWPPHAVCSRQLLLLLLLVTRLGETSPIWLRFEAAGDQTTSGSKNYGGCTLGYFWNDLPPPRATRIGRLFTELLATSCREYRATVRVLALMISRRIRQMRDGRRRPMDAVRLSRSLLGSKEPASQHLVRSPTFLTARERRKGDVTSTGYDETKSIQQSPFTHALQSRLAIGWEFASSILAHHTALSSRYLDLDKPILHEPPRSFATA